MLQGVSGVLLVFCLTLLPTDFGVPLQVFILNLSRGVEHTTTQDVKAGTLYFLTFPH